MESFLFNDNNNNYNAYTNNPANNSLSLLLQSLLFNNSVQQFNQFSLGIKDIVHAMYSNVWNQFIFLYDVYIYLDSFSGK